MNLIYSILVGVLSGVLTKKHLKYSKAIGLLIGLTSYLISKKASKVSIKWFFQNVLLGYFKIVFLEHKKFKSKMIFRSSFTSYMLHTCQFKTDIPYLLSFLAYSRMREDFVLLIFLQLASQTCRIVPSIPLKNNSNGWEMLSLWRQDRYLRRSFWCSSLSAKI